MQGRHGEAFLHQHVGPVLACRDAGLRHSDAGVRGASVELLGALVEHLCRVCKAAEHVTTDTHTMLMQLLGERAVKASGARLVPREMHAMGKIAYLGLWLSGPDSLRGAIY